jgi:hypothetical protein
LAEQFAPGDPFKTKAKSVLQALECTEKQALCGHVIITDQEDLLGKLGTRLTISQVTLENTGVSIAWQVRMEGGIGKNASRVLRSGDKVPRIDNSQNIER